jgi:hypothetical protein
MLKEFEYGINNNNSDDYWYDDRLFYYQEMLSSFSDEEWEALSEVIGDHSEEAQMRCIECLSDVDERKSLAIILKVSNTKNRELFVTCIDALRNMDISSLSHSEKEYLVQRVKEYSADASSIEKIVFKAFLAHIGYEE